MNIEDFTESDIKRFHSKYQVGEPDECWPWKGSSYPNGRGVFQTGGHIGKTHRAPRIALCIKFGSIPDNLQACHSCDNPNCINPNHLWMGTQAQNMADMAAKGRGTSGDKHLSVTHSERIPRGERVHNAKLTDAKVAEIRSRFKAGEITKEEIVKEYNICYRYTNALLSGKRRPPC